MRLETILYASYIACARYLYAPGFDRSKFGRRYRQHCTFHARIISMDAEKDARIAELETNITELLIISAKERIARLEEAQND